MKRHSMQPPEASPIFALSLAWDDTLSTGIGEVDSQHHKLFDIANRLSILRTGRASAEQITAVLHDLQEYTVYHFRTEENLMEQHAISEAHRKSHKLAHQGFIRQVERANKLAPANPDTTADLLHAFLAQWLLHHVANMDRRMGEEVLMAQHGGAISAGDLPKHHDENLLDNITGVFNDLGDRTFGMLELNLQLQSEIDRRKQIELELSQSKARFRMMADHTHSWEYWQGADGSIHYMSPSCQRVTGYTPSEFSENPDLLYRIIHPDDRHLMERHLNDIRHEESEDEEIGFRIVRRDGDIRWIVHSCRALHGPAGDFIGRRGSNRDITDRHTRNDSMMLVATVFESVNEAVLVTNADNRIIVVNSAFTQITGYTPEEVVGHDPGVLADEVPPPEQVSAQWGKLTAKGRWQGEMINRRKNGELYSAAVSIDSVRDEQGEVSNFVLVFSDISERKATEQRLAYLAHHDPLTGLPNWVWFNQQLQQALAAYKKDAPVVLLSVDIDHFKQARDRIGHERSEWLLKEFAARIQSCLNPADIVARAGSDEFLVLLAPRTSIDDAIAVAEHIRHACTQAFALGPDSVCISVSVGVALYPEHGDDAGQILKNADLAMFQAKRAGGSTLCIYNPADWIA